MKKGFRKSMSKTLVLLVALTCITSNVVTLAESIKENVNTNYSITYDTKEVKTKNLVNNPGFEQGKVGWEFNGRASVGSNNPNSGSNQGWAYGGAYVSQKLTIPYSGMYNASACIKSAGGDAKFIIKDAITNKEITSKTMPDSWDYEKYELAPAYITQGTEVIIELWGANSWGDFDDVELVYDRVNQENIIINSDFSVNNGWNLQNSEIQNSKAILKDVASKIDQEVTIPSTGNYDLEMKINSYDTEVKVGIGNNTYTVKPEGDTIKVEDISLRKDENVKVYIEGKAEVYSVKLLLDIKNTDFIGPEIVDIDVRGNSRIGATLSVKYNFTDADDYFEGISKYRWLVADEIEGEYKVIENAISNTFNITEDQRGKYIKCEVIPFNELGIEGKGKLSDPIGPIQINYINNPGFEDKGLGWRYYGANIRYDNSYNGVIRARIAKGTFNYITQEVIVPETGLYDLSAYANAQSDGGKMGIMTLSNELKDSEIIVSTSIKNTTEYEKVDITNIPLEKGEKIKVFFSGAEGSLVSVDNVDLIKSGTLGNLSLNNVISFNLDGQEGNSIINKKDKTIKVLVPYGTDTSKVALNSIQLSEGSVSNLKNGQTLDLSDPLKVNVTNGNGSTDVWSVVCEVERKEAVVRSSNKFLEDSFNWSVDKTEQFVMTGKTGLVNRDENNNDGSGTAKYIPSYWAGYYDRTAFYGRDFVHQATGGQISGLKDENFSMFKTFAKNATESRKWYTFWAINFDGTPHTIDYKNDDLFVREVPAQFELVEKAYEQYLWTGDERYIYDDDLWNFYTKVLTDYISLHDDQNVNGIAEGYGGIFQGSCTYNERGKFPIEAADAIGSQYQATLAYAGMLSARGEDKEAKEWYDKAEVLKKYFNEDWSVIDPNSQNENYATVLQKDGKKLNDFGKENSWFIPMKLLSEPGERNDKYLDFISEKLGDGIGSTEDSPWNIEAYTYIPEAYFPYNRNEEAWKWMKYIMSVKDQAHERATQGTNGDYPEISFTFISHTVEGLMGVEPDAGAHKVVTAPHLPGEVEWVNLDNLQMGDHDLSITHNGLTMTTLTNKASESLNWEARFYGDYKYINVNGEQVKSGQKKVNGELVSYANVEVAANDTVSVEASNTVLEIVNKEELNKLVKDAEALKSEDYTKESWNNFSEALESAKDVASNKKATQIEVDEVAKNLNKAMKDLKLKDNTVVNIDKSDLKEIIKTAENLKASDYTEASWKVFNEALTYAKDIFAKVDVTQEEVDKAVNNLKDAMNKLENNESKDEENKGEDNKDEDKLPNTGDAIGTTALLTLASSLMVAGYALKRKRD